MTSEVMVLKGEKAIGSFEDRATALLYLSQLGIDSNTIDLVEVTPPALMSDLLVEAAAFLKKDRDGTADRFMSNLAVTASVEDAEEALSQARTLLDVLTPDRTKLSNLELAHLIHKEQRANGGNRITLIKQLRAERGLGLAEARDIVQEAHLW